MNPDRPILTRVVEWLLGLDQVRLGRDAPLYLQWNLPFPGWLVLVCGLAILLFITRSYWREQGRRPGRIVLAVLRSALAALVIALICRPVLLLQRERVLPSHVAVLIDTSTSMSQVDREGDSTTEPRASVRAVSPPSSGPEASGHTRLDFVRQALTAHDVEALRVLLQRNQLHVYRFAEDAQLLTTVTDRIEPRPLAHAGSSSPSDLPAVVAQLNALIADGQSTNLTHALEEVLRPAEGGRLAAVILASDGRSTELTPLGEAIATAQAQHIPIYPLLVGSPVPPRDIGIGPVNCDGNVFAKDILAVRVTLEATGLMARTPVTVQLMDEEQGGVVAAETVEIGGRVEVELRTKPRRSGRLRYRLQLVPLEGDADADNNAEVVEVWVHDQPVRVLYVEQLPRFEYRYLKNALVREETVRAGVLLLGADADFAQEGTAPIRRFPEDPEELEGYDVVLFGDVDPSGDWLTGTQAEMLVEFVGRHGGGFGVIAGEHYAPQRFRGTMLERLLPVRIDREFLGAYAETLNNAFVPQVTPEGERSRLFRFDVERVLLGGGGPSTEGETGGGALTPGVKGGLKSAAGASVVSALPGWYWFARTRGPRPGAEVLLEHPTVQTETGPMPLVVLGRYGAGKVLFHASDDTWRWRRGMGELIYDGYWIQVVRALMPWREPGADRRLVIRPKKRRYGFGERVEVQVQTNDPALLAAAEDQMYLTVFDQQGAPVSKVNVQRLGSSSPLYEGSFVPPGVGTFTFALEALTPPEVGLASGGPSASVRVERASLEGRRREADHEALQRLAAETAGEVVPLDGLAAVCAQIRDRDVRIPDDVTETLWDSRLAFILFVVLISSEWILRKVHGMI